MGSGLLRAVDAVTVRVPDLDAGLAFYVGSLGHDMRWRNDEIGQAGLGTPGSPTEIVLTTEHGYEPNWLVESVADAVATIVRGGGAVLVEPFEIPVGVVAVVNDPFDNPLVLIDLSKGRYKVDLVVAKCKASGVAVWPLQMDDDGLAVDRFDAVVTPIARSDGKKRSKRRADAIQCMAFRSARLCPRTLDYTLRY